MQPTIIRDRGTGLPIIATVGEIQQRAMVERGQAIVQQLEAEVRRQATVIEQLRRVLALIVSESDHEVLVFDSRELEPLAARELHDAITETPDGRWVWKLWLAGERADAELARQSQPLSVVGGKAS